MHIDDKELKKFKSKTMTSEDIIAFLEHLDNCDFCLNQMIQQEEKTGSTAPAYLKEQILSKASSPEVQVTKAAAETSQKMQLFYCSLRTAAGVIAALFLLFSVGSIDFTSLRTEQYIQTVSEPEPMKRPKGNQLYDFTRGIGQEITNNTSSVTDYLNNFSSKLLNGGK